MKLHILGCWAPYPRANEACSGYMLEWSGKRILIDLGHGAFSKLQVISDFRRLDAVFISHLHPDHCADLSCLRHAVLGEMRAGRDMQPLPLFIPEEPTERYQQFIGFEDAFSVSTLRLGVETARAAGLEFRFFATAHPIFTCGVAISDGTSSFVYTADTGYCSDLVGHAGGADLILAEASLMGEDADVAANVGHLTAGQAGELAARAGAHKLVLTHFSPEYDPMLLRQQAEKVFPGDVIPAKEFEIYSF